MNCTVIRYPLGIVLEERESSSEPYSAVSDGYEIIHIKKGSFTLTAEGSDYRLSEGAVAAVAQSTYRKLEAAEPAGSFLLLRFPSAALLSEAHPFLEKIAPPSGCTAFPSGQCEHNFSDTLARLDGAATLPEAECSLLARMALTELILRLSLLTEESALTAEDDLIADVVRYLNGNVTQDISLDSLSRRFFVSKFYLCRAFKRRQGISIHGYVTSKRIAYAKQLIAKGESASTVAYKVGYGDYSAFYRAYLKQTGTSPTGSKQI